MGYNSYGQLGDGTTTNQNSPVQSSTGVGSAVVGYSHSLFITTDGALWAAGANSSGQFGTGSVSYYEQSTPLQIVSGTLSAPGAPSAVFATDGDIGTGIRLTWSQPVAAARYEVWRSTSNNSASATRIASNVPGALYYDLTAVSGTTSYYWIKAGNSAGTSSYSGSDSGFVGIVPTINTQPVSQSVLAGTSVTLTVAASGTPTLTYQWHKGGVNIGGATSSSYTIGTVAAGDVGSYRVVVTNSAGSATSTAAALGVIVAPSNAIITITVQ